LRDILLTSSVGDDEVTHISFPDVSHLNLATFVESIYLGSVPTNHDAFEEWKFLVRTFIVNG
jgi:hypothetical protein